MKPYHWAIRAGPSGIIDAKVITTDYVAHGQLSSNNHMHGATSLSTDIYNFSICTFPKQ